MEKSLKEKIYEMIVKRPATTFVELSTLDGFEGALSASTEFLLRNNIVFWPSCSKEAIDSIASLMKEGRITWDSASVMTYALDGCIPNIPQVKKSVNYKYKTTRWYPIVFYKKV